MTAGRPSGQTLFQGYSTMPDSQRPINDVHAVRCRDDGPGHSSDKRHSRHNTLATGSPPRRTSSQKTVTPEPPPHRRNNAPRPRRYVSRSAYASPPGRAVRERSVPQSCPFAARRRLRPAASGHQSSAPTLYRIPDGNSSSTPYRRAGRCRNSDKPPQGLRHSPPCST